MKLIFTNHVYYEKIRKLLVKVFCIFLVIAEIQFWNTCILITLDLIIIVSNIWNYSILKLCISPERPNTSNSIEPVELTVQFNFHNFEKRQKREKIIFGTFHRKKLQEPVIFRNYNKNSLNFTSCLNIDQR